MQEIIVVMTTFKDEEDAARVGRVLVEGKLAACCNIVKGIRSIYIWEGATQEENEVLMLIKTRRGLFHAVEAEIKRLHSYSMPEIAALPVTMGSDVYLHWLERSTL
ncbi:MAG: divalent-cation tolerance protein CutA [Candidatus Omnitrophota bacterium]